MSDDHKKEEHKVCLTWKGRREMISLSQTMTMKELGDAAKTRLGCLPNASVKLSIDYPPHSLELTEEKAISIVPK